MFKHELYKILFNKVSAAFIATIFVVNALQLVWIEGNRYWYLASAYTSIWNDMRERAEDSAEEWQLVLDELKAEYQRMRDINIMEALETPAEYTGNVMYEMELYERVIEELEYPLEYDEYLAGIEATKKRFEIMGSLVDKDNYVYRNLVKTAELYADLEPITLIPESPAGVNMISDSVVTDFLALALFLFFGITVWLKEKEQGMLNLIRTTKNGRVRLAAAKMGALATMCVLCGTVLYVSNIVISGMFYGLGDVTRTIATVPVYRGTLWRISVWEFLTLNLLIKLVAYIWLALLFSVICAGVSGSLSAFGITALMSAGSYIMYVNIPALSAFAVFKYLNPFGMIKTELIFQEYRGLNIFGYPFDYRKCVALVLLMGCVVFSIASTRLFIRPTVTAAAGRHMPKLSEKFLEFYFKLRRRLEMHTSTAMHELHRIFIMGGIAFVLILALVLQISSNQPYRVSYMNLSEYYQRQYLEMLAGPVTEEKIAYIESEQERLRRPADESEQEQRKAINEIASRLSYLEANEGTYFVYDEPFGLLTAADVWNDDLTWAVFFMVLLALSMPSFFAPEWQTGMRKVVSVTLHGKRRLVHIRYIIGVLLVMAIFLITYLPPFLQIFLSYEMKWDTFTYPIGSLTHLSKFGTGMSIGTYLVIVYTLRFVAGVLASLFIYKISAFIKSHVYTMATAFAVLLIPTLMACLDTAALAFVAYPYSAFAGNMFLQDSAAAITCILTVLVISVALSVVGRRRKA